MEKLVTQYNIYTRAQDRRRACPPYYAAAARREQARAVNTYARILRDSFGICLGNIYIQDGPGEDFCDDMRGFLQTQAQRTLSARTRGDSRASDNAADALSGIAGILQAEGCGCCSGTNIDRQGNPPPFAYGQTPIYSLTNKEFSSDLLNSLFDLWRQHEEMRTGGPVFSFNSTYRSRRKSRSRKRRRSRSRKRRRSRSRKRRRSRSRKRRRSRSRKRRRSRKRKRRRSRRVSRNR